MQCKTEKTLLINVLTNEWIATMHNTIIKEIKQMHSQHSLCKDFVFMRRHDLSMFFFSEYIWPVKPTI